jgi:hypothetical protein
MAALIKSPLQFVGEGTLWQLQVRVQRMNTLVAPSAITNPINIDRAEDGFERAALPAAMREQGQRFAINNSQSRSDIARSAETDVRLQEQALDFAATGILLLFDEMEGQLEGGGRGHPLLQVVKLEASGANGRWSWG